LPTKENSGAGLRIKKGKKTYFLGFCTSPNCYGSHLFVSLDEGKSWQLAFGEYGGWIDKNNNLFLWLKMKDIGSLPWLVDFLSGIVFSPTEYKPIYQSNLIEIPLLPEPPSQKWSFAIITDLHIGRGYPDYDGQGFEDGYQGEDYYLTKRLKNVVKWINDNKNDIDCDGTKCPIQFVAVLGDITENTDLIGFCKVKEILDQLEIPYLPLFGNHDVGLDKYFEKENKWKGIEWFDQVFWSTSSIPCKNATSPKNLETLLKEFSFQRDLKNPDYKNFTFSYRDVINFIGLDFVSRKPTPLGKGVGADAVAWREECAVPVPSKTTCPYFVKKQETLDWLEEKLKEFKGKPVILFSHHPLKEDFITAFSEQEISQIKEILKNKKVLFNFGGHIHSFEEIHGILAPANANTKYDPIGNTQVLTTEALMVGSNGKGVKKATKENGVVDGKKGIIRIVKVFGPDDIRPNNWETTETGDEFLAFNPSLNWGFSLRKKAGFPCLEVEAGAFTEKPYLIHWDFGDGETYDRKEKTKCYNTPGIYTITLTLKDKNSSFGESISKKVKIKEGIVVRTIKKGIEHIKKGIDFVSKTAKMSFDKIGQIIKDKVIILKRKSPAYPIGEITIHFERAGEDIDLSKLIADTDSKSGKSILYMEKWPKEVERSKILFVPKK